MSNPFKDYLQAHAESCEECLDLQATDPQGTDPKIWNKITDHALSLAEAAEARYGNY